jgi:uncharacterized protein (UPF0335 family)
MTQHKGDGGFDVDKLKRLASNYKSEMAVMDETRTDISNIMQEVENAGFDKWAFKTAVKLSQMESAKAQARIRGLENYLHAFGVYDQLDMFETERGQALAGADTEQDSVVPIKGGKPAKGAKAGKTAAPAPAASPAEADNPQDIEAAEELGRGACRQGALATDNPYEEDDGDLYDAWTRGFNEAFESGGAGKDAA